MTCMRDRMSLKCYGPCGCAVLSGSAVCPAVITTVNEESKNKTHCHSRLKYGCAIAHAMHAPHAHRVTAPASRPPAPDGLTGDTGPPSQQISLCHPRLSGLWSSLRLARLVCHCPVYTASRKLGLGILYTLRVYVCICLSRYVRRTVSLRRGVGCPGRWGRGGKFTH